LELQTDDVSDSLLGSGISLAVFSAYIKMCNSVIILLNRQVRSICLGSKTLFLLKLIDKIRPIFFVPFVATSEKAKGFNTLKKDLFSV